MIPLFKPFMPPLPCLQEILQSGKLSYGEYTRKFEQRLREYFNTDNVLVTNTFASAISVALTTKNIVGGDEVILSPMGCLVSSQPYLTAGLKIVWADVDPSTGTLCPDSVKKKITTKTKAIVHNHYCGYPGYIDEINAIGKENGLVVIDDGIECFGSEYKNRKVGSGQSDVAIFSLSPVRIPNTIDGGIIVFKSKEDYEKALIVRDCGIDRKRFRDFRGEISLDCDISQLGYSALMSDVNGYIGTCQMEYVDELIAKQRLRARKWDEFFKVKSDITPVSTPNGLSNYWVYGVLANDKIKTLETFRENGFFASGVHVKNNAYSVFNNAENLKGVDDFYSKFLALPCGWWME